MTARRRWPLLAPGLLFALPLVLALPLAVHQGLDGRAWQALAADPQVPRALALSVGTALVSTLAALALALGFVTPLYGSAAWERLARALGPMLSLPHAAFAIGLALLVMPAGVLARLLAPLLQWSAPPDWPTVNDPWGVGLALVLVAKETPFLLWTVVALLARPELALQLRGWLAAGRTLGFRDSALWWRVLWPLLLPRLAWPLLAVLAYGLTVVDLALIIGPAAPPTLAVLAWQGLQDGDTARNAEGAAAALLLATVLAALALGAWVAARALAAPWRAAAVDGRRRPTPPRGTRPGRVHRAPPAAALGWQALVALYAVVALLIVLSSWAGPWSFPALWPQSWTGTAWAQVADAAATVGTSAALGVFAALAALALALAWLEAAPAAWDARALPVVLAPLVVPPLLLMVGLYTLALPLRLDGTGAGLAWVHTLMALPYVFVALAPAWRACDPRYETTARALGRSRAAFWWRVKLPMLAAPAAAALAVGFAVSVAQFLPTQFIGAGRFGSVTTEAVTRAAGGQRHTAAAFAVLQALLPALGFGAAALVGRRQRRRMQAMPAPEPRWPSN